MAKRPNLFDELQFREKGGLNFMLKIFKQQNEQQDEFLNLLHVGGREADASMLLAHSQYAIAFYFFLRDIEFIDIDKISSMK